MDALLSKDRTPSTTRVASADVMALCPMPVIMDRCAQEVKRVIAASMQSRKHETTKMRIRIGKGTGV
jgi:hypothetical protein